MTRGYDSTFNYDPGSKFHVEWWPWVWISHWILIPIPGLNLTLNHDSGSKFNVEFRPGVIIQCGIKTRGHNSTGVQILSVGGVVIQWHPVSGVAIQHEKSVESWAQPVKSRPHGSKFNGVKIQSYTGELVDFLRMLSLCEIFLKSIYFYSVVATLIKKQLPGNPMLSLHRNVPYYSCNYVETFYQYHDTAYNDC